MPSTKRILCVEDDKDTCDVLSFLFREYELQIAGTVEEARKLIQSREFDLYVLDNWLPDGSGVDLCRAIRELKPDLPIIFTSAVAMKKEVDEAVEAGANRYLVKPVEPDTLQETVKELLGE